MTTLLSLNSFQSKYKYKIGGETDLVLSRVGIVVKDSLLFQTLKNSRAREVLALDTTESSTTLTDAQKDKASAQARLSFARDAHRLVKSGYNDPTSKVSAKSTINAVAAIMKDLTTAVTEYISARDAGETTPAEDSEFTVSLRTLHTSLKGMLLSLKGKLRNEGQYYNVNMEQSRKYLDQIADGLTTLSLPPAAPLVAPTPPADNSTSGADTGSGLDITV